MAFRFRRLPLSLLLIGFASCAPYRGAESSGAESSGAESSGAESTPPASETAPAASGSASAAPLSPPPVPVPSAAELLASRERELVTKTFHGGEPKNTLGLQVALIVRTADVPWLFAIRNDSQARVELYADPSALEFELRDPASAEAPPPEGKKQKTAAKKPKPVVCRAGVGPTKNDPTKWIALEPGATLTYAFDPRTLCESPDALVRGKEVVPSFGFPIVTKKVWKSGKSSEVTNEQEEPFIARREVQTEGTPLPLKTLTPSFSPTVLDETYPLAALTALPVEPETGAEPTAVDPNKGPEEPFTISVRPIGTVTDADETVVTITLKHRGKGSQKLFFRREHITYEIQGPRGPMSCRMHPADRAPEAAAYDTFSPGESASLSTRLAEACPLGTFDEPGIYSVHARLEARASGHEVGLEAYTGSVFTTTPARLVVKGAANRPKPAAPAMRVTPP